MKEETDGDLHLSIPLHDRRSLWRFIAVELSCLIFSALRHVW